MTGSRWLIRVRPVAALRCGDGDWLQWSSSTQMFPVVSPLTSQFQLATYHLGSLMRADLHITRLRWGKAPYSCAVSRPCATLDSPHIEQKVIEANTLLRLDNIAII